MKTQKEARFAALHSLLRVKKGTDLSSFKKVTDEDSVDITVTNRGQTNTTTYKGKDALFENEDFAYYELNEVPSYYKELTVSGAVLTFSEVKGTAKKCKRCKCNCISQQLLWRLSAVYDRTSGVSV